MNKIISLIVSCTIILGTMGIPVFASEEQDVTQYEQESEVNEALMMNDGEKTDDLIVTESNITSDKVITLPKKISTGKVTYEMKFKYQNSKGINLTVNNGSGQGTYLIAGQDNGGNDRILITNPSQTAFLTVIRSTGGNPGDDEWHTIKLIIDMDSKTVDVMYDGEEKPEAKTGYNQGEISDFGITFNEGKPGIFSIDYVTITAEGEVIEPTPEPTEEPSYEPVTELNINGIPKVGYTLTVSGTSGDVTWYESDQEDGTYNPISVGKSFTLGFFDVGKWIKAGVGDVYSEPVHDETPNNIIYAEGFDGEIGTEWNNADTIKIENGYLSCESNRQGSAVLTLPKSISSGCIVYEMRFKYQNSKGINLIMQNISSAQGAYLLAGQSNSGEDRVMIADETGTSLEKVVSSFGGVPGDGKEHTIALRINLDSYQKEIQIAFDGKVLDVDTKYNTDVLSKLKFDFLDGKAGMFYIDSVKLSSITDETDDKTGVVLKESKILLNDEELKNGSTVAGNGAAYATALLDNFSGESVPINMIVAVYDNNELKNINIKSVDLFTGLENFEITSDELEVKSGNTVKCYVLKDGIMSAKMVSDSVTPENEEEDSMKYRKDIDVDAREILVSGTVKNPKDREVLVIAKEASAGANEGIVGINSVKPDNSGKFELTIKIDDEIEAENFTLITALNNKGKKDATEAEVKYEIGFTMPSLGKVSNYLTEINSKDKTRLIGATDAMIEENVISSSEFGTDYSEHKDEIMEKMFDYVKEHPVKTVLEYISCMKTYCGLVAMNYSGNKDESFKKYAGAMGINLGDNYSSIENTVGSLYSDVVASMGELQTPDKIKSAFETTVAIAYVNVTSAEKMDSVLKEFNGIYKLDLSGDYGKFSKENKTNVCKLLVNKDFKTVSEIKTAFENGVSLVNKSLSSTVSGGSGNGGAGSSSSTKVPIKMPTGTVKPSIPSEDTYEYYDVPKDRWSYNAVVSLSKEGIINGYNGDFRPENNITREEFAKLLVLAADLYTDNATADFSDVPVSAWYYNYVASIYQAGIINGISDSEFGAGKYISREDMAVMIYRAVKAMGVELKQQREHTEFSDDDNISDYAQEAVKELYQAGLVNGIEDGTFAPKANSSREQAAAMIFNLKTLIK